jgi:hypothetical protein
VTGFDQDWVYTALIAGRFLIDVDLPDQEVRHFRGDGLHERRSGASKLLC